MSDYGETPLAKVFVSIAEQSGDSREFGEQLFSLLPSPLRDADTGKDFLTHLLRYNYGNPFENVAGATVFGTQHLNEVEHLYAALKVAKRYLRADQLREYLTRLNDPEKHADALLEMRPIVDLPDSAHVTYEIPGQGKKHIDWGIRSGIFRIRLDVKNRVKGALAHFADIVAAWNKGIKSAPVPKTDPGSFFLSTQEKFAPDYCPLMLQGIWTHVHIKENRESIESYFYHDVDPHRITFLIICGWKNGAYIVARHSWQKRLLMRIFSLEEGNDFVF